MLQHYSRVTPWSHMEDIYLASTSLTTTYICCPNLVLLRVGYPRHSHEAEIHRSPHEMEVSTSTSSSLCLTEYDALMPVADAIGAWVTSTTIFTRSPYDI